MIGLRSAKSAGVPTDYVSLESLRLSGRFIVYSILVGVPTLGGDSLNL
ncbi:hypothetical protein LEP1GSC168_2201 [Leptospira santarosai str. HAI134]|nr:hypothetical protein LEP1GSC169_1055 [Leptospira santarosai str. HAI1349]EMO22143.1 hypothetical protein LEP1GSC168_2201 [Leptospira santarosai str. HAI134]